MEERKNYGWQCNWLHHSVIVFYTCNRVLAQEIQELEQEINDEVVSLR